MSLDPIALTLEILKDPQFGHLVKDDGIVVWNDESLLVEAAMPHLDATVVRWCTDHNSKMLTTRECEMYTHLASRSENCPSVVRLVVVPKETPQP